MLYAITTPGQGCSADSAHQDFVQLLNEEKLDDDDDGDRVSPVLY